MLTELSLPDLYRSHGFTVTPHLQELVDTYGEREVVSPMEPQTIVIKQMDGRVKDLKFRRRSIQFCHALAIKAGRDSRHQKAEAFMGSPLVPVGYAQAFDLLLTQDGRLVGLGDNLVVTWGPRGYDWRASIAAFLNGEPYRPLGCPEPEEPLPQEEQEAGLADLYHAKGFVLTPHLLALIETYGETAKMPLGEPAPLRADGSLDWARAPEQAMEFHARPLISLGADFGSFKSVAKFLGTSVAPVGRTCGQDITLYLTVDGRLIGCQKSSLVTWGVEGSDWRMSIAARLAGERARKLGVVRWL
ncbi:MAG: hypothetical protein JWO08_3131 [Verrucomicrobiaceae bacterium]|nr:hypothetical protein [Verrucomicrobiaceae bacterium]